MNINRQKIDLAMARKCCNITELAKGYGASTQRIRTILNAKKVSPATAGKIAKALGVDVTEIIED